MIGLKVKGKRLPIVGPPRCPNCGRGKVRLVAPGKAVCPYCGNAWNPNRRRAST